MRGKRGFWFGTFSVLVISGLIFAFLIPSYTSAAINQQISFQGKLTNPDGTNVTNGSYSIRFRIYTDATLDAANACIPGSNTCKWEDSQTITVTDGIFYYALGSNAGAPLPGSVDFNVAGLYLGIKVGTDAEMTPRVRLTAAPYAFNSNALGGIASSGFVQLTPGSQQSGNINISGTVTSGALNGVTLASAADGFTVSGGTASRALRVIGADITIGNTIQPTNAGTLAIQANGANILGLANGTTGSSVNIGNTTSNPTISFLGSGTFSTTTGAISLNGATTVTGTNTLTVTGGATSLTGPAAGSAIALTISTGASTNTGIRINSSGAVANPFEINQQGTGIVASFDTAGDLVLGTTGLATGSITSPKVTTAATASNAIYLMTGDSTTSGNTGMVVLQSGTATSGTAGNIQIDNGGSSTGTPQILVGASSARTINVGNYTAATKVAVLIGSSANGFAVQATGSNQMFSVDASVNDIVNVGVSANGASFKNYLSAGNQATFVANAAPTADMVTITNAGQANTTAGVSGLQINYVGGGAAVEASAERIDLTPGTTSGGTWNGIRIVANATGAVSGVAVSGIKLEGPTTPGAGTETAVSIMTGWDVGIDIASGGVQFGTETSEPTTPAANHVKEYAKLIAGRTMLKVMGPSGINYALQPSLFQQSILLITPGSGTTANAWTGTGGQLASSGTLTMAATTEAQGFMGNVASGTTAGTGAGVSNATNQYYRGSVANGADGFFFVARLSLPDAIASYNNTTTGSRIFAGLSSLGIVGAAGMTSADAPAGDYAGFEYAPSLDAVNFRFITRDNATTNGASTGVALAIGKTYDFYIYAKPNDGTNTVYWRIDNLTDGTAPVEGSTTTNVPRNTISMKAGVALAPLSTTAHNIRIQRVYTETDR